MVGKTVGDNSARILSNIMKLELMSFRKYYYMDLKAMAVEKIWETRITTRLETIQHCQ
jgi:hypothetical protein